jgi:hypothetical protein
VELNTPGGENVPPWSEDANSPFESPDGSELTAALGSDYDIIRIHAKSAHSSGGGVIIHRLQVNGDTGQNYQAREGDGASSTQDSWKFFGVDDGETGFSTATLTTGAAFGSAITFAPEPNPVNASAVVAGENETIGPDINSITVTSDSANIDSLKMRVYGVSV